MQSRDLIILYIWQMYGADERMANVTHFVLVHMTCSTCVSRDPTWSRSNEQHASGLSRGYM